MAINVKIINVAFLVLLLIRLLEDVLKRRKEREERRKYQEESSTPFSKITVLLNFIIAISYVGYGLYEFWNLKAFDFGSLFTCLAWMLASADVVYSFSRIFKEQKRWPLLLIIWWLFSATFDCLLISFYLLKKVQFLQVRESLLDINVVDVAAFPLSILLCFNALPSHCEKGQKDNEQEQPFLGVHSHQLEHRDPFSSAGIWSKLSFMWLNTLYKRGRLAKLELEDVPEIPQSETAAGAFSALEESLRGQKTEQILLLNAILNTMWRPLALNAAFAGSFLLFLLQDIPYYR